MKRNITPALLALALTGFTFREACMLQSTMLRQHAQQIVSRTHENIPMEKLLRMLAELEELQQQVHQLEEFLDLLDQDAAVLHMLRIGSPN